MRCPLLPLGPASVSQTSALPLRQTWGMCRVISGSPLTGHRNTGLSGRRGNRASPPWLHTQTRTPPRHQSNWTAADTGGNFLSGCTRMHSEFAAQRGGLAGGARFYLQPSAAISGTGWVVYRVAADYYAHTRSSLAPRYLFWFQRPRCLPRARFHADAITPSSPGQLSTRCGGYRPKLSRRWREGARRGRRKTPSPSSPELHRGARAKKKKSSPRGRKCQRSCTSLGRAGALALFNSELGCQEKKNTPPPQHCQSREA